MKFGTGRDHLIHLHEQATTTPEIRAVIRASTEPAPVPAARFGIHRSGRLQVAQARQRRVSQQHTPTAADDADVGAKDRGGGSAQDTDGVARRPAREGAGHPEPDRESSYLQATITRASSAVSWVHPGAGLATAPIQP